jgi:hypothetical protein
MEAAALADLLGAHVSPAVPPRLEHDVLELAATGLFRRAALVGGAPRRVESRDQPVADLLELPEREDPRSRAAARRSRGERKTVGGGDACEARLEAGNLTPQPLTSRPLVDDRGVWQERGRRADTPDLRLGQRSGPRTGITSVEHSPHPPQPPIGALGLPPQKIAVPTIPIRCTITMLSTIDLAVAVPTPTGPPEAV